MPIAGETPSQAFLTIIREELTPIEAHLNIHDTALFRLFHLYTALMSNIRNPVPRLIDDTDPKLPIHVRYQKYQSDRDYLRRLLAIHPQTPRKAFLERIHGELELVQKRLSELQQIDTASLAPVEFRRRHPGPLDLRSVFKPNIPPVLPSALASARFIDDLSRVPYPENIQSPKVELNINAKDGKFRYDRDFLLQFMSICKEKPDNLPSLEVSGIAPVNQNAMTRTVQRKRLILQPRSKPTAEEQGLTMAEAIPAGSDNSFNDGKEATVEMSEEAVNKKISEDSKEFFAVRNLDEAEFYFSTLPVAHHHRLVEKLVGTAIESKKANVQLVADFFVRVVSKELCSVVAFEGGFSPLVEILEDISIDAPKAPNNMALMMKAAFFDSERAARLAAKSSDPDKLLALL
ncbi:hypothetical protein C8R44DRAFT_20626 [Mycena epipterygia]|nr:hypothetical protein C8R44DRAFT_20626 [Mycena epipterygia]